MVHGGDDEHAGRYLVVKQPADLPAQDGLELLVGRVVGAVAVRVQAAGKAWLKQLQARTGVP